MAVLNIRSLAIRMMCAISFSLLLCAQTTEQKSAGGGLLG